MTILTLLKDDKITIKDVWFFVVRDLPKHRPMIKVPFQFVCTPQHWNFDLNQTICEASYFNPHFIRGSVYAIQPGYTPRGTRRSNEWFHPHHCLADMFCVLDSALR